MLTLDHFVGSGKILARDIGEAQTLALLEQYGGQCFWISKAPKASHSTSRKLGLKAHVILSEYWPEKEFELPMASHVHKNMRNDDIKADAQHMSMREMIAKYKLSRAQIQTILRKDINAPDTESQNEQTRQLKLSGF
jgi:Mor family transcriptional regulator